MKNFKDILMIFIIITIISLYFGAAITGPKSPSLFLVTYHFQSEYTDGVGNIYLSMKNHRWDEPDKYRTNELISESLTEDNPGQDFNIVILNIIPLPVNN